METLHNEEETQILMYKKKLGEYETGREMLRTLVGPELFRVFDDLIEVSARVSIGPASSSQTDHEAETLRLRSIIFSQTCNIKTTGNCFFYYLNANASRMVPFRFGPVLT